MKATKPGRRADKAWTRSRWRTDAQLRGVQAQVQAVINRCDDEACRFHCQLPVGLCLTIIECLLQARFTESAYNEGKNES